MSTVKSEVILSKYLHNNMPPLLEAVLNLTELVVLNLWVEHGKIMFYLRHLILLTGIGVLFLETMFFLQIVLILFEAHSHPGRNGRSFG